MGLHSDRGTIDWPDVLGFSGLVGRVKQSGGWTSEDLKEHVRFVKENKTAELDRFADGELEQLKGTKLYPFVLEITALRYIAAKAGV